MQDVNRNHDRILTRLRRALRERGFTQLQVQEVAGWGRNYISKLFTRKKSLRIDQLLTILNVIELHPADFFGEIFQFGEFRDTRHPGERVPAATTLPETVAEELLDSLRSTAKLLDGLVTVLVQNGLIDRRELDAAAEKFRRKSRR